MHLEMLWADLSSRPQVAALLCPRVPGGPGDQAPNELRLLLHSAKVTTLLTIICLEDGSFADEGVIYYTSGMNMKPISSVVWRCERIDPGGGEGDAGSNEQESVLG